MCCPAGMCYASMTIKDLGQVWIGVGDQFFEFGDLANLLEGKYFVLLVSIDS